MALGGKLPDGPSGRVAIAFSHLSPSSSEYYDYLVLFDDGTLGMKYSEKTNYLQTSQPKSFDGSQYSMLYHSPSDFSSSEFELNSNTGLMTFNLFSSLMTLTYILLYIFYRKSFSFPEFIPLGLNFIFAILFVYPILAQKIILSILKTSSGELKIFTKNSDPYIFDIASKGEAIAATIALTQFMIALLIVFSNDVLGEIILISLTCLMLIFSLVQILPMQLAIPPNKEGLVYGYELREFREKVIHLTKELLEREKISSPLLDLLLANESVSLEFKASLWTQYIGTSNELVKKQEKKFLKLEDAVVKTVAAFLNTEGGTLLIGVQDKPRDSEPGTVAKVLGIEPDFKWLKKGRRDTEGFQHELFTIFTNAYSNQIAVSKHIHISFPVIENKTLCRVDVTPLKQTKGNQCYTNVKENTEYGKKELFFARISDTSRNMSPQTAHGYITEHFEDPYR